MRNFSCENFKYSTLFLFAIFPFALPAIIKAIKNGKCDVIYGDAILFGEVDDVWDLSNLQLHMLCKENQLSNCNVFSKEI